MGRARRRVDPNLFVSFQVPNQTKPHLLRPNLRQCVSSRLLARLLRNQLPPNRQRKNRPPQTRRVDTVGPVKQEIEVRRSGVPRQSEPAKLERARRAATPVPAAAPPADRTTPSTHPPSPRSASARRGAGGR